MSDIRCLEAIDARRPMSTNIFDLRRAERAGHVSAERVGCVQRWSLTDAGKERLAAHRAEAAKDPPQP